MSNTDPLELLLTIYKNIVYEHSSWHYHASSHFTSYKMCQFSLQSGNRVSIFTVLALLTFLSACSPEVTGALAGTNVLAEFMPTVQQPPFCKCKLLCFMRKSHM